jgi:DNA-binding response OmpR family regulator
MMPGVVLAVGFDHSLMTTRIRVLQSAGYAVARVSSLKEAVYHFLSSDFDLVLLCHSIPSADRERLTCLIRASGSLTPVVSITETTGKHDAFPTATLEENDTNEFLANLREIISKAARRSLIRPARAGNKGDVAGCTMATKQKERIGRIDQRYRV